MSILSTTNQHITLSVLVTAVNNTKANNKSKLSYLSLDILQPLRKWLDELEIKNPKIGHFFARVIPAQCPFERDIILFGSKVGHIPPLCKLNPLYEQLVGLRFRALCYLADQCGEDIQSYH